jgi:Domain of unknown function (DUF4436)
VTALSPRRRHLLLDVSIIAGVFVVYVLSLVGYHLLATAPGPLPEPVLNTADGTVVLVRFEQLHTVANRLDVKVLVMPDDSMINKRFNVLNTDTSVRFFPQNDLGDLQNPVGKLPAQVATTIEAHGDAGTGRSTRTRPTTSRQMSWWGQEKIANTNPAGSR